VSAGSCWPAESGGHRRPEEAVEALKKIFHQGGLIPEDLRLRAGRLSSYITRVAALARGNDDGETAGPNQAKRPHWEDTTMAIITIEVSDHDLASLRDMATATDPRGSGAGRRYSTVEKLAADLLSLFGR
jgi:hypothetical protein